MVVLPHTGPWVAEFLHEVTNFPNARFDDQADALAQMLANPAPQFDRTDNVGPVTFVGDRFSDQWEVDLYPDLEDDPWGSS